MSVSRIQRTEAIRRLLYEKGHVEVRELSERFDISEATARRDLRGMADQGDVELVYGGATLPRKNNYSLDTRRTRNIEAKRVIGRLAADLVQNGDTIFLESGSTLGCMVPHLPGKQDLEVITNSTTIASELGEKTDFPIVMTGGKFRFQRMDLVGPFAELTIDQLSGYRAFLGADGVSLDFGLTGVDIETAHLYQCVVRRAAETTLLIDHTKLAAPTTYKIIDWSAINRLVTDRPLPPDWQAAMDRHDIDVIVPEQDHTQNA